MSLFHRHRWEVKAVMYGRDGDGYLATCALRMCECGDFASKSLHGYWTLEQLTPKAEVAKDREFLKTLGVRV